MPGRTQRDVRSRVRRNANVGARAGAVSKLDLHGDAPTKSIRFSLLRHATFRQYLQRLAGTGEERQEDHAQDNPEAKRREPPTTDLGRSDRDSSAGSSAAQDATIWSCEHVFTDRSGRPWKSTTSNGCYLAPGHPFP